MQNKHDDSNIKHAEAFLATFKEGVERLREKDQELTDRYIKNMTTFLK